MKKRLLLAAVCILTLPIWFSPYDGDKTMGSTPFATVAIAGHVPQSGVYCKGTPPYCGHSAADNIIINNDEGDGVFYHSDSLAGASRSFVSATLVIGIALMMWTRSRA